MSPEGHTLEVPLTITNIATGVESTVPFFITCPIDYQGSYTIVPGESVNESAGAHGPSVTIGEVFYFQSGRLLEIKRLSELAGEWHIKFFLCEQQSQVLGSVNEHAIARLYFRIWSGDDFNFQAMRSLQAVINQPAGENLSFNTMPLEVTMPQELNGEVNYNDFRDRAEDYYRFALANSGINFGVNARDIVYGNNRILVEYYTRLFKTNNLTNRAW